MCKAYVCKAFSSFSDSALANTKPTSHLPYDCLLCRCISLARLPKNQLWFGFLEGFCLLQRWKAVYNVDRWGSPPAAFCWIYHHLPPPAGRELPNTNLKRKESCSEDEPLPSVIILPYHVSTRQRLSKYQQSYWWALTGKLRNKIDLDKFVLHSWSSLRFTSE